MGMAGTASTGLGSRQSRRQQDFPDLAVNPQRQPAAHNVFVPHRAAIAAVSGPIVK